MNKLTYIKGAILKALTYKKTILLDHKKINKVLILKYDRIGDMVVTTPLFREIKKEIPRVDIFVLSSEKNYDVIAYNPYIHKIYIKPESGPLKILSILFAIRRQSIDVCIDLEHSIEYKTIFLLKFIKPKLILSTYKNGRYGISGTKLRLYDHLTPSDSFNHNHFRNIYLETLKFLEINNPSEELDVFYTEKQHKKSIEFTSSFENKIKIGINIEGSWEGKKIHANDLYIICTELFKNDHNIIIILISYPSIEREIHRIINNMNLPYVIQSYSTNTILDAAALINKLDVIITPDTSITHIASAVDTDIVTIHENNMDTHRLMGPTSKLSKTVFSRTYDGLYDYSAIDVAKNAILIINTKKIMK